MIKIAICDDESNICFQLEQIVEDIAKDYSIEYEIEVFYTGEILCDYLA